jgi:hypothetical protein
LTIKKKKKETINNNAQLFIVGKNRQRHLRPSVGGNQKETKTQKPNQHEIIRN